MPILVFIIIYFCIALLITRNHNHQSSYEQRKLWLITFVIYLLYTFVAQSYVSDPEKSFFMNRDQMFYYSNSINLSHESFSNIFKKTFSEFEYSEAPLIFCLFGTLAKVGAILGSTNIFLFLLTHITFLASLIPVFIYKIVSENSKTTVNLYRNLLIFACISPILTFSCQLMRDMHICFVYTLMAYLALRKKQSLRYLWLIILLVVAYYLRKENGLFAFAIIAVPMYESFKKGSLLVKSLFVIFVVVFCLFVVGTIINTATNTINNYNFRSQSMASDSSLGNKLNLLPFPLDVLSKSIFSQIMPFPIWYPFKEHMAYDYLRFPECLWPFYWIPLWISLVYSWFKYRKEWDLNLKLFFYVSILYILLCSAGEFNTRRLMAVYPIIVSIYYILGSKFDLKQRKSFTYGTLGYLALHSIYIFIKL